jgi:aminoglycoside 6'-N-acetyltransferase I
MHIEACQSVQQPGWLSLRLALWPEGGAHAHLPEMQELVDTPQRYGQFVCYAQGEAAGFIELALRHDYVNGTETSPVAFVEGLYVAPQWRRQGVGRRLMDAAFAWARAQGCSEIASDAALDNLTSHATHRALGFVETERVVYFVKRLGSA